VHGDVRVGDPAETPPDVVVLGALCKTAQQRGPVTCIVTGTTGGCDRRQHLTRKRPCMPTQKS
jgi:hypothetical protein